MLSHDISLISGKQCQQLGEITTVTEDCLKVQPLAIFCRPCGQPTPSPTAHPRLSMTLQYRFLVRKNDAYCWEILQPLQWRHQDAEEPTSIVKKLLKTHSSATDAWEPRAQCRPQWSPAASSSDPAGRAVPLALLIFMLTHLINDLLSMLHSSLWRDRGINPNFYQVRQEASTTAA